MEPRKSPTPRLRNSAQARAVPSRNAKPRGGAKTKVVLLAVLVIVLLIALACFGCFGGKNTAETKQTTNTTQQQATSQANGKAGNSPLRTETERMATSSSLNEEKPGRHVVYLTFDDGPSTNTHRILDTLNQYGVHATWFIKGNQAQIAYAKDIWDAGNQVAIHTYTHDYQQVYASVNSYWEDVELAGQAIKEQIGFIPTLVRFPGGSTCSYSTAIQDELIAGMAQRQLHYFDWNVSCGDGADHSAAEIAQYVREGADGCKSACVLMHDSAAKDTTADALPEIIEYFIDEGFEFDVLTADSFGYHF